METIELRESDKRRAVNLNRKNGYGLNFHREVEMLMNGKYDELKEQVKQW